jgi:aldose 1-epimerase
VAQPELVSISSGDSVCTICPAVGGSIAGWSVGGQDMLRRADTAAIAAGDPLMMASFPLVPFSNRIGHARFTWDGRNIDLTPNFAPEPHAIHGTGWKEVWAVTQREDSQCILSLRHEGDARWPWSFEASQTFTLTNNTLEMTLRASNRTRERVPLAIGHHPYFDQHGAQLSFNAAEVLMSGDDALPTKAVAPAGQYDFSNGGTVTGRSIDHCYAGWGGSARIAWAGRPFALEISADMAAAVVYVPLGGSAFCFEPVPHINNALNRPGQSPGMPVVGPGNNFTSTIRLQAVGA